MFASLAAGLAILYAPALQEGLPRVAGDIYDGRIFNAVLEHWYGVVQGQNPPLSPRYFYPYPFTLSYGDGRMMVHEEDIVVRAGGAELLTERAPPALPVI